MKIIVVILIAISSLYPAAVLAITVGPKFSIDPASPSIGKSTQGGTITPDDVLIKGPTGPIVLTEGTSLGLQDDYQNGYFDNLNALSYGRDPVTRPGSEIPVIFSVDRVAVGVSGSAVFGQAQPGVESAHGDLFQALPPLKSNALSINESRLGLVQGFFGDDLDALELDSTDTSSTYFSIDLLSASNDFGMNVYANDIYLNTFDPQNPFAFGETHMGLDTKDDLDALVLWDVYEPGVLNPGIDMALFSLSSFSFSTFTFTGNEYKPGVKDYLSPADILFTDFNGDFELWASAGEIGLLPDDELDALDTVPEPGTFLLVAGGGIVLLAWARKRKIEP